MGECDRKPLIKLKAHLRVCLFLHLRLPIRPGDVGMLFITHDVSFTVEKGECLGILGESGSGKSTLGRVMCSLLKPFKGSMEIDGLDLYNSKDSLELGTLAVVLQDYTTSVNTRFTVRDIINESFIVLKRRNGETIDVNGECIKLLELVGLSEDFLNT